MNDTESTHSTPSLRVLEEIAAVEVVSPAALEPALNDVVDPAVLDRLFEPTVIDDSVRGGHVSFRYRGYDNLASYRFGTKRLRAHWTASSDSERYIRKVLKGCDYTSWKGRRHQK